MMASTLKFDNVNNAKNSVIPGIIVSKCLCCCSELKIVQKTERSAQEFVLLECLDDLIYDSNPDHDRLILS